jgi:hypothetical protein
MLTSLLSHDLVVPTILLSFERIVLFTTSLGHDPALFSGNLKGGYLGKLAAVFKNIL